MFFCGVSVSVSVKQCLLDQLGFVEGKLPIKYLGLPLISSRLRESDCSPIIAKLQRKTQSWSAKMLTYAGRLFIKSVLFHFQAYWASIVMLPKGIIKQIEAICRSYLWSGNSNSKKMPLVAWESICLPRHEGGLGILQTAVWNKAATGKMLWKIISNADCLWVQWARVVYLKGNSI